MTKTVKNNATYYEFWFGLNELYDIWAKAHGVRVNTLFVLHVIDEYSEECTLSFISDKLLLPKQTVHSILNELEKAGYIQKVPMSKDKRNKKLVFTEEGKAYADDILSQMYIAEDEAFTEMGEKKNDFLDNSNLFLNMLKETFKNKKVSN